VNDAPETVPVSPSTPEDTPIDIPVLKNATDVDGNTTLIIYVCTDPAHGSAVVNTSTTPNTITYTPAANFNGLDSFTYKVSDGFLNSSCVTANVTVTPGVHALWDSGCAFYCCVCMW
jgi:hypothetical protein